MQLCVLGRQPEIGLAELEALYGADSVQPLGAECALIDAPVNFARLGGSIKSGVILAEIPHLAPQRIFAEVTKLLPGIIKNLPPEGKIKLGISTYGLGFSARAVCGETLKIKKILRQKYGRSVRAVPNETPALSSAQTFHNQLTSTLGVEIIIVYTPERTVIARTEHVQNIDDYRIRDRDRPKRDAFVGMLPPKLAQTIINLAAAQNQPSDDFIVLDPFCGTGVVLQEALLMGFATYGTDLSQKMIDFSHINLDWLIKNPRFKANNNFRLEQADATDHIWRQPISAIACEGYLGQPLGGQHVTAERLQKIIAETDSVMRGFLQTIAEQIKPGTRLCIAGPAWFVGNQTHHLPVTNELAELGYTRHTFKTAPNPIIYRREDQVTGRELIVLTKD